MKFDILEYRFGDEPFDEDVEEQAIKGKVIASKTMYLTIRISFCCSNCNISWKSTVVYIMYLIYIPKYVIFSVIPAKVSVAQLLKKPKTRMRGRPAERDDDNSDSIGN